MLMMLQLLELLWRIALMNDDDCVEDVPVPALIPQVSTGIDFGRQNVAPCRFNSFFCWKSLGIESSYFFLSLLIL